MPSLHDLQQALLQDIYHGSTNSHAFLDAPSLGSGRLAIYQNNCLLTLTQTLGNMFPVIEKLGGSAFFQNLSRDFIRSHPLLSGNRNEFGQHFAEFLQQHPATVELPYLPDMARLEWAMFQAAFAPNATALKFADLADLLQDAAFVLSPHPSLHIIDLRFNVPTIWQAHQTSDVATIELQANTQQLVLWRDPQFSIIYKPASPALLALIRLGQAGTPFAQALSRALELATDQAVFQQEFAETITHGLFTSHGMNHA